MFDSKEKVHKDNQFYRREYFKDWDDTCNLTFLVMIQSPLLQTQPGNKNRR